MTRTLSNVSEIATEETNTTGVLSTILSVSPNDGLILEFLNRVARGEEMGLPIYAILEDANGDPLPQDSEVVLRYKAPDMTEPRAVSIPFENISAYNIHTLSQQQNEEFVDMVKHELKGEAVRVRDIDELQVALKSSTQIDWSNSRLHFEEKGINEFPEDGG